MTKAKTSKKIRQPKGLEPDMKGSLKRQVGITNLSAKKEIDPVAAQQNALLKVMELKEEIKVRLDLIEQIKTDELLQPLLAQWEEYEDTDENPIIRSETTTTKAYLQISNKYKYSEACDKKAKVIENKKADLKAAQEKEVREGKAVFIKQTITVTVRSS